jgi:signal recognition particle receptor subunit beta
MVLFNHATREMTAKIVYYGPGLCGKTTNLLVIFDKLDPKSKGKMLSLATKTDRTLFFDLLPVDIGKVGNFNLKIQLYTVPGQVFYNETRKLVLKGADAVVFVADSQPSMIESNRESFANLMDNLEENQIDPNEVPIVIQFNKRDIPGVLSVEDLQERLSLEGYPYMEASAIQGQGVMETFKLVSKITAKYLIGKLQGKPAKKEPSKPKGRRSPQAAPTPEPAAEPAMVNPFADSLPFGESAPVERDYEAAEEVSLEQLLEGRERPATIGGNVPIPVIIDQSAEDVEELQAEEMLAPEPTIRRPPPPRDPTMEVRFDPSMLEEDRVEEPEPSGLTVGTEELEAEVLRLQGELEDLRREHEELREAVARGLADLTRLVQR